jgi:lysophospholipase L1-like esterase
MILSRRNFLKSSAVSTATLASIPAIIASCIKKEDSGRNILESDNVILFQGDSITDARREKKMELPNNASSFGNGYAYIAASQLLRKYPEKNLSLFNRGISGNKVYQLAERWDRDCLDLNPDVLSILIGVNDYWHMRNGRYDGTPETYENDYRQLLERTRGRLPEIKLAICQPFILKNTEAVDESWIEPFKAYQDIARKLSGEFDASWIPFQEVFDEAVKYAPENYWLPDGVHPSMAGAQLMAEAWLKSIT